MLQLPSDGVPTPHNPAAARTGCTSAPPTPTVVSVVSAQACRCRLVSVRKNGETSPGDAPPSPFAGRRVNRRRSESLPRKALCFVRRVRINVAIIKRRSVQTGRSTHRTAHRTRSGVIHIRCGVAVIRDVRAQLNAISSNPPP